MRKMMVRDFCLTSPPSRSCKWLYADTKRNLDTSRYTSIPNRRLPLFPLRPRLFGNLIPQQANIWMGVSPSGSSRLVTFANVLHFLFENSRSQNDSGLHHDYADNLYILLSGRKRFTIFPPSSAPNLYVNASISEIHPNGLISYTNTRSDGAFASDVAKWRVGILEGRLKELLRNQECATSSQNQEEIEKIEESIEDAMGELLENGQDEEGDFEFGEDEDDFDAFDNDDDVGRINNKKSSSNKFGRAMV